MEDDFLQKRHTMVSGQLKKRGLKDTLVLTAMENVPRHEFVPEKLKSRAYEDNPLPIGEGQTISQPYVVAYMTELLQLKGGEKVLEIGTGCGYAAAVLGEIAAAVYTIERHEPLARRAEETLKRLKYDNVHVVCGDGTKGLPAKAPFDAIVVTAAGPSIPAALKQQLKIGGRLVIPVGLMSHMQDLVRVTRMGETDFREEKLIIVSFVPLIGEAGWKDKSREA